MSMSALSLLQEQNARNASLAFQASFLSNMKYDHDELNKSSPLSPASLVGATLPNAGMHETSNLYSGLTSIGMLTPQMFAANQTAAALLSKLYPHPSFFSWQLPPMAVASPPISPISSALSIKSVKNNNNIVPTTTSEELTNNNYKLNMQDDLKRHISRSSISPQTSGSSPQSIGSMEHQSLSTIRATPNKEPTRDKSFTCQTCNRSFGYKHVLQNHERTHTGEKPYACEICNKRFTRDHHLKTHMRLHTGEKPYHCKYCDKQFVQVANLRRHLRVHTGEKPYVCDQCNCKYSDSNQLKAHMIIHKDEKPYRCETCSASFRHSHHLVNHKCANAPLTPATSPAISLENNSIASRSETSERSSDLSTSNAPLLKHFKMEQRAAQQTNPSHEMPLDLSVESNLESSEKRNTHKSNDPRNILRMLKEDAIKMTPISEQIEPEDLSTYSSRSESTLFNEEDLDDLDDAETLNRKQNLQKATNC